MSRFSENELMWKKRAKTFAVKEMRPLALIQDKERAQEKFLFEFMKKSSEAGLRHWWIPEEYSGLGGSTSMISCLVAEELAWGCLGLLEGISGPSLPGRFILSMASENQKSVFLKELARKDKMIVPAFALTEEGAGSDVMAITTEALPSGDGFSITGKKKFITNGDIADIFVVVTKMLVGSKRILKIFLIDKNKTGPVPSVRLTTSGVRAAHVAELTFDDYKVPKSAMLGFGDRDPEENDLLSFLKTMETARISVGAAALGVAQGALEFTIDYAKKRRISSGPLIHHQGIHFPLVDCLAELQAARSLVHAAARMADAGEPFPQSEANLSKLFATITAEKIVNKCAEIVSAHGYLEDSLMDKWLRDVRVCKIWEGTGNVIRMASAASIF